MTKSIRDELARSHQSAIGEMLRLLLIDNKPNPDGSLVLTPEQAKVLKTLSFGDFGKLPQPVQDAIYDIADKGIAACHKHQNQVSPLLLAQIATEISERSSDICFLPDLWRKHRLNGRSPSEIDYDMCHIFR